MLSSNMIIRPTKLEFPHPAPRNNREVHQTSYEPFMLCPNICFILSHVLISSIIGGILVTIGALIRQNDLKSEILVTTLGGAITGPAMALFIAGCWARDDKIFMPEYLFLLNATIMTAPLMGQAILDTDDFKYDRVLADTYIGFASLAGAAIVTTLIVAECIGLCNCLCGKNGICACCNPPPRRRHVHNPQPHNPPVESYVTDATFRL